MGQYRKCKECGRNNVYYTSGGSHSTDGAVGSIFGEMKGHICDECKADKKKEKKTEKAAQKRDKERMAQSNSNNSSSSGASSSEDALAAASAVAGATAGVVMAASSIIGEISGNLKKPYKKKMSVINSLPTPSNAEDLKRTFMELTEFVDYGTSMNEGTIILGQKKELSELAISKLETYLKIWKVNYINDPSYEQTKDIFEEELQKCRSKKNILLRNNAIIFLVFFGGAAAFFAFFASMTP